MRALKQNRVSSDTTTAIVSHPLRARCWLSLTDKVASPAELAQEFGESVNDVAYHVRVLGKMGVIEKVSERQVRGAIQTFWRAIARPDFDRDAVAKMDPEVALANARLISQLSYAEVSLSLDSGKFVERDEHIAFRIPLVLDEEGWTEVSEAYDDLLELLYDIQARSADRVAQKPDLEQINAVGLGFLFEKPQS